MYIYIYLTWYHSLDETSSCFTTRRSRQLPWSTSICRCRICRRTGETRWEPREGAMKDFPSAKTNIHWVYFVLIWYSLLGNKHHLPGKSFFSHQTKSAMVSAMWNDQARFILEPESSNFWPHLSYLSKIVTLTKVFFLFQDGWYTLW